MSARVRLTKTPEQYLATRATRRELSYEALLGNGRDDWAPGERIRVYRRTRGRAGLLADTDGENTPGDELTSDPDPRDYDIDFYLRLLRDTFAARLARGLSADDFAAICADPGQPSLFDKPLRDARPVLTVLADPLQSGADLSDKTNP